MSLADAFLEDLEDDVGAGAEEAEDQEGDESAGEDDNGEAGEEVQVKEEPQDEESKDLMEIEKSREQAIEEAAKNAAFANIAKIRNSKRMKKHLEKITELMQNPRSDGVVGPIEEDPEYQLIVESNQLSIEIENEVAVLHKYVRDLYAHKFPELESLVLNPLDYARVVRTIGNEMDMTLIDLTGILPSATIMVVSVTGSTTSGTPLDDAQLANVMQGCTEILELDACKKKIIDYVESRMSFIAPNVSAIVGSSIAAKIVAAAGGLVALSKIPGCNVQVLGKRKKNLAGMSTASALPHAGFIYTADIVQNTPPSLRVKAQRVIAAKLTLAARIDSFHEAPDGSVGKKFLADITKRLEKLQEPPPPRAPKPLPAPDSKPRTKRAGKRVRRMKERYVMSEVRKAANRIAFGKAEEEYQATGRGFGLLGVEGSGKLRITPKDQKIMTKAKMKLIKQRPTGSSGLTSGISSSIVFTPVQGLELVNPNAQPAGKKDGGKYFSSSGTFSQIKKEPASLLPGPK
eukprot:tig00001107_g7097.t1